MDVDKEKRIFGENLTYYVDRSGKEQKQIAKELGYAPTTFNTWCKGKIIPSMGKVQKIADYFHIGKSDLIELHTPKEQASLDIQVARMDNEIKEKMIILNEFDAVRRKHVFELIDMLNNKGNA